MKIKGSVNLILFSWLIGTIFPTAADPQISATAPILIGLYPTGEAAIEDATSPRYSFRYSSDPITVTEKGKAQIFVGTLHFKDWKLNWSIIGFDGSALLYPQSREELAKFSHFRLSVSVIYSGPLCQKQLQEWYAKSPNSPPPTGYFLSRKQQENLRPEVLLVPALGVSVNPTLPRPSFFARWLGATAPRRFSGSAQSPSNFVLILDDALRPDHTPPYGHPFISAPHIETLASLGAVFRQSYGASTSTRPSVGSIFSGLHPVAHGAVRHSSESAWMHEGVPLLAEAFFKKGFSTAGIAGNAQITGQFGFNRGFQVYECPVWENQIGSKGIERLQKLSEPFFLYLHFMAPHAPYQPPPEYQNLYDKLTPYPEQDRYCGEVTTDDHRLGLVLKELARQGLLDRTLIWFISDHGEEFWEHGWNGHGAKLYEETARTVSIVTYPARFPMGTQIDNPITHVEMFPTLADIFELEKPRTLQGISLVSWLSGKMDIPSSTRPLYLHHGGGAGPGPHESDKEAILLDRKKLIWWTQKNEWELYDLTSDPGEKQNLYGKQMDAVKLLETLLKNYLQACESIGQEYTFPAEINKTIRLRPEDVENLRAGGYVK